METVRCWLCKQTKNDTRAWLPPALQLTPFCLRCFNAVSFSPKSPKPASLNSGSLNSGSLNSESLNSESLNSESLNSESLNPESLNSRASWANFPAINFVLARRQRSSDQNKSQQAPMKRHPPGNPISSNHPTSLVLPAERLRQQHLSHQPTETQRPAEICHRVRSACIFPHHKIHPRRPNPIQ